MEDAKFTSGAIRPEWAVAQIAEVKMILNALKN